MIAGLFDRLRPAKNVKAGSSSSMSSSSTQTPTALLFPTTLADLDLSATSSTVSVYSSIKDLRKATLSISNRLRSIVSDAEWVESVSRHLDLPLVANERCGSWYISPEYRKGGVGSCSSSAYFKSTDGHHGQWDFSQRRLNLQLLEVLGGGVRGGAVVVDSTRRGKTMPDAFSKTVPIWVAVLNRALFPKLKRYHPLQRPPAPDQLGESEVSQIDARLAGFVKSFRDLRLDLALLKSKLKRPIHIVWAVNGISSLERTIDGTAFISSSRSSSQQQRSGVSSDVPVEADCCTLVLCSASRRVEGAEMSEGGYIQGAGDDSEGWSCGLMPQLFWQFKDELLQTPEDDLPDFIHRLLQEYHSNNSLNPSTQMETLIRPTSNIFLAAGQRCQDDGFDLIINCQGPRETGSARILDLKCRPGKLGSKDLRGHFRTAKSFVATMLERKADCRILITCFTGNDLSVGVALVLLCSSFEDSGELRSGHFPVVWVIDKQLVRRRLAWITTSKPDANPSRSTLQAVNSFLMERPE